ncbi:MAG: TVP38/TMEM64 family protein [Nitrospiraceae bacterium]|nr:TVP38/TMEM64 family protein [Nitrospiraceae bacterium]
MALLVLIVAGSIFILYKSGLVAFFLSRERIAEFLNSLGPFSFLGFIALQSIQVIAAPIPGEVTGFIGGYAYGILGGILFSTIGLTIGSFVAFSLTRYFGHPFIEKFVKKETMEKYDYLLHHKGAFLVFLLFLIPGFPKDSLCYILGLGHLTAKEFLIISTVGRFAGTVLLTLGGDYIQRKEYYSFSILIGIAIILIFLAMVYRQKLEYIFKRLHRTSTKEKDGK